MYSSYILTFVQEEETGHKLILAFKNYPMKIFPLQKYLKYILLLIWPISTMFSLKIQFKLFWNKWFSLQNNLHVVPLNIFTSLCKC